MDIALINTNRIKPPIAPIGLDYLAESLASKGHHPIMLDLCFEGDFISALKDFFNSRSFDLVGITLRNTDDCAFTSRKSFVMEFSSIVKTVKNQTDALVVVGGVGFSVMPQNIMENCKADAGIWGDGEFVLTELVKRIEKKQGWFDLPNLVWHKDGVFHKNKHFFPPLENLPTMGRNWIDNRRYFSEGGQAGIETKRGCNRKCIYCADPIAKGRIIRSRPAEDVVDELERLLEQGIDHFHTCDSEFNLPMEHAERVCEEIIRRNLGEKIKFYAYCSPVPFSKEFVKLLRGAGFAGINFGVDSCDEGMLKRLKRDFTPEEISNTVRLCKDEGLTVMLDLLLGTPGETEESIVSTIEIMKKIDPHRVGISMGVRVYPGTELSNHVVKYDVKRGLVDGTDPLEPQFFIEPAIAPFAFELLNNLINEDNRFLFFDPSRPKQNYNYNSNQRLCEAISKGYRGAYWDILRRYE